MALKHRIEKLEKRGGKGVPPFIVFIKGQKTGDGSLKYPR